MPRTSASHSQPAEPTLPSVVDAWDELSAVLDEIAEAAHREQDEQAFDRKLIACCITALSAESGAVWGADASGRMRRRVVSGAAGPVAPEQESQESHESLLVRAIAERAPQVQATGAEQPVVIAAPIVVDTLSAPTSLIEVTLRAGAAPSAYQSAKRFLEAACEIAAERRLREQLRTLRDEQGVQRALLDLARKVQAGGDLKRTAYRIANQARTVIGCDRLSVLTIEDRRPRLVAVSGAERVDRRSASARELESLAACAGLFDEPLCMLDRANEHEASSPQAVEALQRYADASHARQVIALPVGVAVDPEDEESEPEGQRAVIGVLVAEQFDAASGDVRRDVLAEAADAIAPALATAVQIDGLPLLGVSKSLKEWLLPRRLRRATAVVVAVAATALALALTPAEFTVESPGELHPVVQQQVFTPRDAVVEAVLVEHGQQVQAGEVLVELRDAELELAIKQIEGELATSRRQLDAAQSMRTGIDSRDANRADLYRITSEAERLRVRIDSLATERDLLHSQRDSLRVLSPSTGTVLSWRVDETLLGRPVQRGQVLMTVADTSGDWQVELRTPDDKIGYLLEASEQADQPLRVEYRLASQERGFESGVVTHIAQRAQPPREPNGSPTVLVTVEPNDPASPAAEAQAIRPGQSVRARVHCGRRSLAYVWLHDLWRVGRTWWEF